MGEPKAEEAPYVVIDGHNNTGIFLLRGRKFVHIIDRAPPHFRLHRVSKHQFETEFRPLHYYSNGAPGKVPYDVQDAAQKYLQFSKNVGITETALRFLTNIIQGKYDMTQVESAQTGKEEVVVPQMEKLDTALKNANKKTPKSSTKSGTTPAAKRASKAKILEPAALEPAPSKSSNGSGHPVAAESSKEKDMRAATQTAGRGKGKTPAAVVMKGAKSAAKKAPAAKKPTAKKAPAAKTPAKGKKTAAAATGQGRSPSIPDDYVLTHVAENPKRKGTEAFRKFAQYKVGMRIGDVVKKNVDRADVNYNLSRGFIKVKKG